MEWLKKILTNVWFYVFLFAFSLLFPLIINEAYKRGQGTEYAYETIWGAPEAYAFFGDYLSFFGTVILGAVALFQTERANNQTEKANDLSEKALAQSKRANELAAQMHKLEQAKFVSMVSVKAVFVTRQSINNPTIINGVMPNPIILDLVDRNYMAFSHCYHINLEVKNESEWPIVHIGAHASGVYDTSAIRYGIADAENEAYIPPHGEINFRFIIPSDIFEKYNEREVRLHLRFTNVFDYLTKADVMVEDVTGSHSLSKFTYRLNKVESIDSE